MPRWCPPWHMILTFCHRSPHAFFSCRKMGSISTGHLLGTQVAKHANWTLPFFKNDVPIKKKLHWFSEIFWPAMELMAPYMGIKVLAIPQDWDWRLSGWWLSHPHDPNYWRKIEMFQTTSQVFYESGWTSSQVLSPFVSFLDHNQSLGLPWYTRIHAHTYTPWYILKIQTDMTGTGLR